MKLVVSRHKRPHVVAVAAGVVRQEGHRVHVPGGEVIDRAEQALPFSVLPRGITRRPVLNMRRVGLERHGGLHRAGAVEVFVREQRFWRVGANFQKIVARARKPQMVATDVLQPAERAEIGDGLIRGCDAKRAAQAVEWCQRHRVPRSRRVHRDVPPGHEADSPVPSSGLVGREMCTPSVAVRGRRIGRVAVGREVAGHVVGRRTRLVDERDRHSMIAKRVWIVPRLGALRTVQCQRHFVPQAQLACDRDESGGGIWPSGRPTDSRHASVSDGFMSAPDESGGPV